MHHMQRIVNGVNSSNDMHPKAKVKKVSSVITIFI